jgi:hypothetical protein
MKKYLTLLLTLCLLFCISCNSDKNNNSDSLPKINVNETNNSATIRFDSYKQLYQSLSVSTSKAHAELISQSENYDLTEDYNVLLDKFSKKELELYIPTIDNVPIEMKEETGGITLFSSELFKLPWIWYRGEYNGGSVVVCITYTAIMENVENCKTYLEVQNVIAPSAPNPNNFSDENYVKVEEIEKLFNGTAQTALFKQATDDRTYYSFLQDGMMISIWSHSSDTLDDTFWQSFSLVPYTQAIK